MNPAGDMPPARIVSRANSRVQALIRLAKRSRERREQRRTIIDGAHLLQAYLDAGGVPASVVVSDSALERPEVARLLARVPAVDVMLLPDSLYASASVVEHPSGLMAVIPIPPTDRAIHPCDCLVLCEGVQDPGNVGSLLRCAAAAGAARVGFGGSAEAWSPRALRAGMGAHFRLSIAEEVDLPDAIRGFRGQVLATVARGGDDLYACDLRGPTLVLVGGEGSGLSTNLLGLAHRRVTIPMASGVESLNVAAALAVVLFERRRQLLGAGVADRADQ